MRQSGLVLLLPHGFDGGGPEHSSARLERFLQLSDSDPFKVPPVEESERKQLQQANWAIVNISTPANYFHALRRQIHRDFRKPLVVMSHKWLLRYPASFSSLSEFNDTKRFQRLLPEATPEALVPPSKITRIVFCSGQVYYNLLQARIDHSIKDVVLARIEQLYPFPFDLVSKQMELYPNAEVYWCQEEPMNMGAWNFVFLHLVTASGKRNVSPKYAGRPVSASPAVASTSVHKRQQEKFLSEALNYPLPPPSQTSAAH